MNRHEWIRLVLCGWVAGVVSNLTSVVFLNPSRMTMCDKRDAAHRRGGNVRFDGATAPALIALAGEWTRSRGPRPAR